MAPRRCPAFLLAVLALSTTGCWADAAGPSRDQGRAQPDGASEGAGHGKAFFEATVAEHAHASTDAAANRVRPLVPKGRERIMRSESSILQVDSRPIEGAPVPAVVYVTSSEQALSGSLQELWEANRAFFQPGTKLEYFNDAQMAISVREISAELEAAGVVHGAYQAFANLRPGAFRADLWRYMILWSKGGIYMDAKMKLLVPLDQWIDFKGGSLQLVKDWMLGGVYNAVIASGPRQPLLAKTISLVVTQIQGHDYCSQDSAFDCNLAGFDCRAHSPGYLAITGPLAFAKAVGLAGVAGKQGQWTYSNFDTQGAPQPTFTAHLILDEAQLLCKRKLTIAKNDNTGQIVAEVSNALHCSQEGGQYFYFWLNHQVYCDESGPPCLLAK